ncbi:MAG: hypothetical protein ABUS54_05315 [Actinomycetota bacterium]
MATDLTSGDAVREPETTGGPATPMPHRARFLVIYVGLAAVLGVAIAGIVIYGTKSIAPDAAWSSWAPGGGGLGRESQIAAHVAQEYHLPSGGQLVEVFAKAPSVSPSNTQIPLHYVVVARPKGYDAPIPITSDDTVQYSLCGLGSNCAIATGTPSVQRGTLVRREILELALYTFKYMSGVKNVVAFMPPTPGATPKYVVFLQRSDLSDYLHRPLAETLNKKTPLPNAITRLEQQTIDATTESKVYSFGLSQAQNGDAVLVLTPIAA